MSVRFIALYIYMSHMIYCIAYVYSAVSERLFGAWIMSQHGGVGTSQSRTTTHQLEGKTMTYASISKIAVEQMFCHRLVVHCWCM